jgi:hypothetical protein
MSAMNEMSLGKRPIVASNETKSEQPIDAAWLVLEAANDVGDHATVDICRRVIDTTLKGTPVSPSDLDVILNYFR